VPAARTRAVPASVPSRPGAAAPAPSRATPARPLSRASAIFILLRC